jgi:hypothetical protein
MRPLQRFELTVGKDWIAEFRRTYGGLIPIRPDLIQHAWGQLSLLPQINRLRSNCFETRISRLHINGRAFEANMEPSIYEVTYQVEAFENPLTLIGFNTYVTVGHVHSYGFVDRALDRADSVSEVVSEDVEKSMRKRAIGDGVDPSILEIRTPGATSNAYTHKLGRVLRRLLPRAYYIEVFQVNDLAEVSREEANRRFDLMIEDVGFWTAKDWKLLINYPFVSKLSSSHVSAGSQSIRTFNDRLGELLSFLIELQAEYQGFIKAGVTSPSLDLELIRLYTHRMITIVSTVNYVPVNLNDVEWLVDSKLLTPLKDELEDRLSIIGCFASSDMLESIKSSIGGDVRAFAIRSNKYDRKYIIAIRLTKEEAEALMGSFKGTREAQGEVQVQHGIRWT